MKPSYTHKCLPLLLCLLFTMPAICFAQKPELVVRTGHSAGLNAVAFSPDGRMLASGGEDNMVTLWDVTTSMQLRSLFSDDSVEAVAFSPNGRMLASGGTDKTVKLWDVATGMQLRSLVGHTSYVFTIAFSPDGRMLASGGTDKTVRLWDVATGKQIRSLNDHSSTVTSVVFSPDGKTLSSGGLDDRHRLWEVDTGTLMRSLEGTANSVMISPDGETLALGGSGNKITLWDLKSGIQLRSLEGHNHWVQSVAFSPDGKTLASGSSDTSVMLWEVATGRHLRTFVGNSGSVKSVAISPNGRILASGGEDKTVRLWDMNSGAQLRSLEGQIQPVSSIAFNPDGKTLASGGWDNTVRLWDLRSGATLFSLNGHTGKVLKVAFSPDGRTLASGSLDDTVRLWDRATGRQLHLLKGHTRGVNAVAFSPDGKTLASGDTYWAVRLWDVKSGAQLRSLRGHTHSVNALAFSPDGSMLASGSEDWSIRFWDVATGAQLRLIRGHAHSVNTVTFSPDGRTLASGGKDQTVRLWDVATGMQLRSLAGYTSYVNEVAFSPNGRTLASGDADNIIKLWEVETSVQLRSFVGHTQWVSSVAFSRDGRILASGGWDAKIKLWDTENWQELVNLITFDQNEWLVIAPDGLFDGSSETWTKVIWRAPQNTLDYVSVEAYFSDFYYPGLLADIFAGQRPQAAARIEDKDRRQPRVRILSSELLANSDRQVASGRGASGTFMRVTLEVIESPADAYHQRGSGARDVRLFRNGTLVKIWHGHVLADKGSVNLTADVPVAPGDVNFTAYAFNSDNVKSRDASLTTNVAPSVMGKPSRTAYVLAIGVNRYDAKPFNIQNLKYAVADARAFGDEWQRQQVSLRQFQRVEVVPLFDSEATKSNILLALRRLAEPSSGQLPKGAPPQLGLLRYAEPQDAVVVYFAGHGTAEGKQRFYLIPHDLAPMAETKGESQAGREVLLSRSVSDLELETVFEGLQAGSLLLIIDACNSGQALEAEERRRGPMNSKGLAQLAYEKGMYVLTASQSFQAAQEATQLGHGLLTYALVEEGLRLTMADTVPDGRIYIREWLDYATERVPQMQLEKMKAARSVDKDLSFSDEERGLSVERRSGQRPRVFYRREEMPQPLVVAVKGATPRIK